jgi:hypothetical protein
MIIDTTKITALASKHLKVVIPTALIALSWFATLRWQSALDTNKIAFMVFYFCLAGVSGIGAVVFAIEYLSQVMDGR